MAMVHGGRLVSKALARQGVTHLFTLCGGHIQAIYDGCLDEAVKKGWNSWTCARCHLMALQPTADGAGIESYATQRRLA